MSPAEGNLLKREDDNDSAERGIANIRTIDANGDGQFTPAEILAGGEAAGLSPDFTNKLAQWVNKNGGVADEKTISDIIYEVDN